MLGRGEPEREHGPAEQCVPSVLCSQRAVGAFNADAPPALPRVAWCAGVRLAWTHSACLPCCTVCDGPGEGNVEVETTKEELLGFHEEMYRVRRMEIACDTEYKARNIRGFCHLYDGQEAVASGLQAGLDKTDNVISTYRCHALQLVRGDSVSSILAELFGLEQGSSMGKGGSMHFYSKKNRFWGGAGIVGAQVPVGAGLAFADKYLAGGFPSPITMAMYGDGAANQGQIWEAANMAKLWNLPVVFLCENNQYGMGTSTDRSSANVNYYQQGGVIIPGVRCDGMDVLAVKKCVQWVKEYVGGGSGPLFLEMKTYRYHGHSMSDPGLTYRNRDEVASMRKTKDCIELVKSRLMEAGWATEAELKEKEKEVRAEVARALEEAKAGHEPRAELLDRDIFLDEMPAHVRMPDNAKSIIRA